MDQTNFVRQWREAGKRELFAAVTPSTINDEERTVDIVWFTGIDVPRYSWSEGSYTLRLDPKGADLSRLKSGAPVCNNHWMVDVEDQLGVVLDAWKDGANYLATLKFKRSTEKTGPRPDCDGLWQDIKDGIVGKFSMGVELLKIEDTREKDGVLKLRTATHWRPFELSVAPIPADPGTQTMSSGASVSVDRRAPEMERMRLALELPETATDTEVLLASYNLLQLKHDNVRLAIDVLCSQNYLKNPFAD